MRIIPFSQKWYNWTDEAVMDVGAASFTIVSPKADIGETIENYSAAWAIAPPAAADSTHATHPLIIDQISGSTPPVSNA